MLIGVLVYVSISFLITIFTELISLITLLLPICLFVLCLRVSLMMFFLWLWYLFSIYNGTPAPGRRSSAPLHCKQPRWK